MRSPGAAHLPALPLPALPLLLLLTGAVLGRVVRVPSGPLLRVEGTDVSVSCDVRDYEGPREQNFEWLYSSGAGPAVQLLSTWDSTFTHASYRERVASQSVRLLRTGNSEVQLHIQQLRAADEGNYTCSTPSTDATYSGNYQAHVQLRVIADSLRLQVPKGRRASVHNVTEGGSFQVQCLASLEDAPTHAHLSVTWQRQSGGSVTDVLTLTHLGRLQPGADYASRYSGGELRVGTAEPDAYQLTVEAAQPGDAGQYSCVAQTWVQGAEGWEKIQEKRAAAAQVEVRPIELSVSIVEPALVVSEGASFALSCLVSVDSSAPLLTRVRWFFSHQGGLRPLPNGPDPDPDQEANATNWLLVPQARDSGDYTCQASAWTVLRNGTWRRAAEGTSPPLSVRVTQGDSSILVAARLITMVSAAGGTFEMICTVQAQSLPSPQYSVQVTRRPPQEGAAPVMVISLSRDGVVRRRPGAVIHTVLEKGKEGAYLFRLSAAQNQDLGSYQCEIAAWTQGGGGAWRRAHNKTTNPVPLEFQASGLEFNVSARSDRLSVYPGETSEFWCIITIDGPAVEPDSMAFEVSWFVQRPGGPSVLLAAADRSTRVRHNERNGSSEAALERVSDMEYRLRVYGCQKEDAGGHYCTITPWVRSREGGWSQQETVTSAIMSLSVRMDCPEFNVSARSDRLSVYPGETSEFWCIITIDGPAVEPDSMAFEVSWFVQRPGGPSVLLAAADRSTQVRHNERNSSSEAALERVSDMEYRLRVYGCQKGDAGGHYCTVTPWVRSREGGWSQQETVTSAIVSLSVRMDLLTTFRTPLLIGAGLSLLAGLLSCLIGYCSSRFCCKAPPVQEKRREHRRLMSMEMD